MNWDALRQEAPAVSPCPILWRAKKRPTNSSALLVEREGGLRTSGHVDRLFLSHAKNISDAGVPLVILAHSEPPELPLRDADARAIILQTVEILNEHRIDTAAFLYCTHGLERECLCRHPFPGLLQSAAANLKIDLSHSLYLGASVADLEAGITAGVPTLLVDLQNAQHYAETFQLAHEVLVDTLPLF